MNVLKLSMWLPTEWLGVFGCENGGQCVELHDCRSFVSQFRNIFFFSMGRPLVLGAWKHAAAHQSIPLEVGYPVVACM